MSNAAETEARQRASALRRKQTHVRDMLTPGALHVVLYIRSDTPVPNDFHWALYLHTGNPGGHQYHVRARNGSLEPAHETILNIMAGHFLCILIEVATLHQDKVTYGRVDQIMKSFDATLNLVSGLNCRTWVLMVLHMLVGAEMVHLNIELLEKECLDFGNGFSIAASLDVQPRPVVKSMFA
ncbi:hypothetical protein MYU51_002665 [Penicillium brevicompactum]|uniref:Uncharacterized protein n=1 Tax=Penicillium brevicompactum TaxID=5074 RepID=A0A9W9QTS0_PENBR|nr:uncharacterized protein N7506_011107 [Penicillium brevicompactum]KAJ5321977.1 hypothetical protein N7506_011107 [Penicillium brevicompactum]KAJ5344759.1 hypothetical protein N7452_002763 [Penicillium brevicompactum]